jgi:hypothetical protein
MLLAQHVSGIIMPIVRSKEMNQQTAYDVQHWSCCVRLAQKRQVRVHLLGVKRRLTSTYLHLEGE